MAKNIIKGLTIEIGGDTTKLGKALENVNKKSSELSSELGEVNRLLKMDPGNADLVAQKQKVLASAVENTKEKLKTLKEAARQVQEQFKRGEASEAQVRALQREVIGATQKLKSYEKAAKESTSAMVKLGLETQKSRDELNAFATKGLKVVGGLVTGAIAGLTAAAESSRDYRMEMGKLNTAFTESGFSSEAATNAYKDLVGVLGETDQSVETANHLAKLTDNEKDLAKWTGDILPGVFATFGDSLPIEGLTEAANETAKVGKVTGPLADALNWAGVSEDAFNASLEKCTTEQERQALITETLTGLYGSASEAYKTTNADVIEANQANDALAASTAKVGETVEPLLTKLKDIGATLLEKLVPVIEWVVDNLPTVGVVVGGITAALVALKIATLAATIAQNGLNLAMLANPIGLIIIAITALVAAIVYLWNNIDSFKEFFINAGEKIKEAWDTVVQWFSELPGKIWNAIVGALQRVYEWGVQLGVKAREAATTFLNNVVNTLKEIPQKIWNAVVGALQTVYNWGVQLGAKAKAAATTFLNNVVNTLKAIPTRIWNAIVGAVQTVYNWGVQLVNSARTAVTNFLNTVGNTLREIPSRVWNAIVGAVQSVVRWGAQLVAKGKAAAQKLVSSVVNGIKSIPGKMVEAGRNLVQGLWKGISGAFGWIKDKITGWVGNVTGFIKKLFGIASPSKETEWMGEMLAEGLGQGITENAKSPLDAMSALSDDLLDQETAAVSGLTLDRKLSATFAPEAQAATAADGLMAKLDRILSAIERGQVLTIDGRELVGATIDYYDSQLGQRRVLAERGAR